MKWALLQFILSLYTVSVLELPHGINRMFLQVEIFENESLTPSATHYATLVSRSSEQDPIWSLGRKQGSFLAKDDRSVSRLHATLEILSANKTHNLDGPHAPKACTTPEQVEACKSAGDQMCVVVQNLGKLGSFCIRDRSKASLQNTTNGDDSDTADEEEVIHTQSQTALSADIKLSKISQKLYPDGGTIKSILANETLILHELSVPQQEDDSRDEAATPQRAVVQCGKLGTTIVVTRHHIRLTPTSQVKKQLAALPDLYAIGAKVVSPATKGPYHYFVTEQYNASQSQLTAWSLGVPFVNMSFVQALLDRSSVTNPLPQTTDHLPESDDKDFWNSPANPRLWETCTLLSTHMSGHDIESMILAAGAKMIPLHKNSKVWLKDAEVVELLKTINYPFAIQDSKKKVCKLLKKHHVPLLTQKDVAAAISEQRLLRDGEGNPIGTETKQEKEEAVADGKPVAEEETTDKPNAPDQEVAKDASSALEKEAPEPSSKSARHDPSSVDKNATPPGDEEAPEPSTNKKRGRESTVVSSKATKSVKDVVEHQSKPSKKSKKAAEIETAGVKNKDKGRTRRKDTADASMEAVDNDLPDDDAMPVDAEDGDKQPAEETAKETNENISPVILEPMKPRTGERKALTKNATGGWLSALPQGEGRRDYIRSKEEIMDLTGLETVAAAATTEIVQSFAPPPEKQCVAEKRSGKDFKAFRKNTVPPPPSGNVEMETVLARESERTETLEKEQAEIAEQQRKADELFRDPTPRNRARYRR